MQVSMKGAFNTVSLFHSTMDYPIKQFWLIHFKSFVWSHFLRFTVNCCILQCIIATTLLQYLIHEPVWGYSFRAITQNQPMQQISTVTYFCVSLKGTSQIQWVSAHWNKSFEFRKTWGQLHWCSALIHSECCSKKNASRSFVWSLSCWHHIKCAKTFPYVSQI